MLALTSFVHLAKPLSSQATCVSPVLLNTLTHSRTLLSPLKAHSDASSSVSHTLSHALRDCYGRSLSHSRLALSLSSIPNGWRAARTARVARVVDARPSSPAT